MFKTIDSDIMMGSCPFCNSSEAFRFKENDYFMFLCHDCQRYMRFENTGIKLNESISNTINFNNLRHLFNNVWELPESHEARQYVSSRRIPYNSPIYYTDNFAELSVKYSETPVKNDKRICFLIYNGNNDLVGVTGRSIEKKTEMRYITLMFDKNESKVYGRERVNMSKTFVAVEGPIDSLFVKNAIAMNGAEGLDNKYTTNAIICFDNEPRNRQIVAKMKKSLEAGFKVVIWPKSIKNKDINEMVLDGIDAQRVINENIYSGLSGLLKLNEWKK